MCLSNASEVSISMKDWNEIFPDGFPACYTDTDLLIDIKASLPHIAKGKEKEFTQWATSRNAEIAQRLDSCRIRGAFPLLNALKNAPSDQILNEEEKEN